jgi:hypothetical protein
MLAKGGQPKGMMVVIGIGKPKGPMKKAEGGTTSTNPNLGPEPLQMPSDEQINKENWNQRKAIRRAMGAKNTGKDTFAKGGMAHEDVAADKSLIKSMVKPGALKKAMGGPAVQMAKSKAIESSLKGQKKTGYADGGMTGQPIPDDVLSRYSAAKAAPQGPLYKMTLEDGRSVTGERQNVDRKFAPAMKSMGLEIGAKPAGSREELVAPRSPLQQMVRKSVPVAPRAPMIPQQAAPAAGGPRIGVGRSRSGKPNVGAIRAAMAKAATKSMPENAPEVMKKGGKVC